MTRFSPVVGGIVAQANTDDENFWREVRNEPLVRNASCVNKEEVSWAAHHAWFQHAVRDTKNQILFIVTRKVRRPDGGPDRLERCGIARLHLQGDHTNLWLAIPEQYRGQGIGGGMLRWITQYMDDRRMPPLRIAAPGYNTIALRMFMRAGMRPLSEKKWFTLQRPSPKKRKVQHGEAQQR